MIPSVTYFDSNKVKSIIDNKRMNVGGLPFGKEVNDHMKAKIASRMLRVNENLATSPFVRVVSGIHHKSKPEHFVVISNGNAIDNLSYHADFDYRPMGGITGFSTSLAGKGGALRKGKITWQCNSRTEYEYLSRFFLTPGTYMLIEWGSSLGVQYCLNYRKICKTVAPENVFTNMVESISQNVYKSFYEYDGMIGLVKNVDSSFKQDGTIEAGIEFTENNRDSIWATTTQNQFTKVKAEDGDNVNAGNSEGSKPVSGIDKVYACLTNDAAVSPDIRLADIALAVAKGEKGGSPYYIKDRFYAIIDSAAKNPGKSEESQNTVTPGQPSDMDALNDSHKKNDTSGSLKIIEKIEGVNADTGEFPGGDSSGPTNATYINIGLLEELINVTYNDSKTVDPINLSGIRWNSWDRYCSWTAKGINSSDLSICIFPLVKNLEGAEGECGLMTDKSIYAGKFVNEKFTGKREWETPVNIDTKGAYISRIMVNIEFIRSCFSSDNNIVNAMQKIADGISKASCGLMDLSVLPVQPDAGGVTFKFQDLSYIHSDIINADKNKKRKLFRFETLNGNGILKNINFNTKFSDAYAAMIVFESQKAKKGSEIQSQDVIDTNIQALLYSFESKDMQGEGRLGAIDSNFSDRFVPKLSPAEQEKIKKSSETITMSDEDKRCVELIKTYISKLTSQEEAEDIIKDTSSEKFKFYKQVIKEIDKVVSDTVPEVYSSKFRWEFWTPEVWTKTAIFKENKGITVTPVKLDIELNGMSGWNMGTLINLDSLPKGFIEQGMFLINGVSNDINGGTWTTKISSVFRPQIFNQIKGDDKVIYDRKLSGDLIGGIIATRPKDNAVTEVDEENYTVPKTNNSKFSDTEFESLCQKVANEIGDCGSGVGPPHWKGIALCLAFEGWKPKHYKPIENPHPGYNWVIGYGVNCYKHIENKYGIPISPYYYLEIDKGLRTFVHMAKSRYATNMIKLIKNRKGIIKDNYTYGALLSMSWNFGEGFTTYGWFRNFYKTGEIPFNPGGQTILKQRRLSEIYLSKNKDFDSLAEGKVRSLARLLKTKY